MGDSVVVSRGALDEDLLGLGKEERSLQELIDSELALRQSRVHDAMSVPEDRDNMTRSTMDFLEAETRHTCRSLDDRSNNTNTTNSVSDTTDSENDWTTVEEVVSRMNNPTEINEINHNDVKFSDDTNTATNTVCINNNYSDVIISETFSTTKKTAEIVVETRTTTQTVTRGEYEQVTTRTEESLDNHIVTDRITESTNTNTETNRDEESVADNHCEIPDNRPATPSPVRVDRTDDNGAESHIVDQVDRYVEKQDQQIIDSRHLITVSTLLSHKKLNLVSIIRLI